MIYNNQCGYYSEQHTLLYHVFQSLGFDVTRYHVRVLHDIPPEVDSRFTHLILLVIIDGINRMCDIVFRGLTPTHPIPCGIEEDFLSPYDPHVNLKESIQPHYSIKPKLVGIGLTYT